MTFTSTSVATLGGLDIISTTVADPSLLADANVTAQLSATALGLDECYGGDQDGGTTGDLLSAVTDCKISAGEFEG